MAKRPVYDTFSRKIDGFVSGMLEGYEPQRGDNKVIHDPIWGSVLYYSWELEILDTPLLQRLRNIYQVGLALLTYPSARHSRFEHTLGVIHLAAEIAERINQKSSINGGNSIVRDHEIYMLRLAGLLHDVGHCFYSHLSETIYGKLKEFEDLRSETPEFKDAKPHEIFSYLIINCSTFKQFFKDKISFPNKEKWVDDFFFEDIGNMIIGQPVSYQQKTGDIKVYKTFMTDIINGQYDSDKLDYIKRDSYISGLALAYDIERFLYKVDIRIQAVESRDNPGEHIENHSLVIPISGITAVEELVFSKLMLFSYIYHHQKVLAAETIIKDLIQAMIVTGMLRHPCDFLNYTDIEIENMVNNDTKFDESNSEKTIGSLVRQIRHRKLPKRCLVINAGTFRNDTFETGAMVLEKIDKVIDDFCKVKGKAKAKEQVRQCLNGLGYDEPKTCSQLQKIYSFSKSLKKMFDIRAEIYGAMCEICAKLHKRVDFDLYDIHVVIPPAMNVSKEALNVSLLTMEGEVKRLADVMPLSDWAESFSSNKWNAYVFSRPDLFELTNIAARKVFEKHGITFNGNICKNLKHSKRIEKFQKDLIEAE